MRSIPIDVLRAFVAVVEARGFTRAAEDLGRSQPTVSLQVKRLEELMEAPLFEKVARFELTAVGSVCFDYGRRLLKLHDEMLNEAGRRKAPEARLRIGMPGECTAALTPRLDRLRSETNALAGVDVASGDSEALAVAFRQKELDLAVLIGAEAEDEAAARWRAPLAWFGRLGERPETKTNPLRLVLPPSGSAIHDAALGALKSVDRSFEIACASADFAVRVAAVSAGLGIAPMVVGLAPEGLARLTDPGLPAPPPLVVSLVAHSEALAAAGRRWASEALSALPPA